MSSSVTWKAVKARVASTQWLIITAMILTAYGWLHYDYTAVWERAFYLRSLTLPLALAFMAGAFPATAPFNPDNSENFWKVASISFKLFLIVLAVTLWLFKLNSGN